MASAFLLKEGRAQEWITSSEVTIIRTSIPHGITTLLSVSSICSLPSSELFSR